MEITKKIFFDLKLNSAEFHTILQTLKVAKSEYINGCPEEIETKKIISEMEEMWGKK